MLPEQVTVPRAHEAFGDDGRLKDSKQQASIENLGSILVGIVTRLSVSAPAPGR